MNVQKNIPDLVAGLSIAGLLLPEAVAYSNIANLPPQAGIIGLLVGLLCYGLVGTSKYAIVSATSSSAAVLAASVVSLSPVTEVSHKLLLSSGLVIVTGVLFLVAALGKMGNVTSFIARPVLRGFTFGVALVITIKQFADMAAIHVGGNFFNVTLTLVQQYAHWNWTGVFTGLIACLLLFLAKPYKKVPAGLLIIVLGIIFSQQFSLAKQGLEVVGPIMLSLSHPQFPALTTSAWLKLLEVGFALVMVLYAESYSSIRIFALKHRDETHPNRDLCALGIANFFSGLFHGTPVGAGFSATTANESYGAASKWSGVIAAFIVGLVVMTSLHYVEQTPKPILDAIVIFAVAHTLNPAIFKNAFLWKRDRAVSLVSIVGVLLLGVLDGLLVAIALSIMMTLKRFSEPLISELGRLDGGHDYVDIENYPDAQRMDGLMIFRPDEPLFFANADNVFSQIKKRMLNASGNHAIIISLEESPDMDITTLESIHDFYLLTDQLQKKLYFARVKPAVKHLLLDSHLIPDHVAITDLSVDDAVQLAQSKILQN